VEECQRNHTTHTTLQRIWTKNRETWREIHPNFADEHMKGTASIMLQRWYQESMCSQPYNNIGGVAVIPPRGDVGQILYQRSDGSSAQRFERDNKGNAGK
jgi:hypothetical protein